MGWETRRGRRYYYRKIRGEEGRVRSVYCGTGERGERAAREDAERAAKRLGDTRTDEAPLAPVMVEAREPPTVAPDVPPAPVAQRPAPARRSGLLSTPAARREEMARLIRWRAEKGVGAWGRRRGGA